VWKETTPSRGTIPSTTVNVTIDVLWEFYTRYYNLRDDIQLKNPSTFSHVFCTFVRNITTDIMFMYQRCGVWILVS